MPRERKEGKQKEMSGGKEGTTKRSCELADIPGMGHKKFEIPFYHSEESHHLQEMTFS